MPPSGPCLLSWPAILVACTTGPAGAPAARPEPPAARSQPVARGTPVLEARPAPARSTASANAPPLVPASREPVLATHGPLTDDTRSGVVPIAITMETPTEPFGRARPEGRIEASLEDEALARWNVGGNGDATHPSNRSGYHPAVRVLVETAVLGGAPVRSQRGGLDARRIQAQARKHAYWNIRVCYEWGLRRDPSMSGVTTLRFSIPTAGAVSYARPIDSELDDAAARCLLDAFRSLKFDPRPSRRVDVEASIRLWPGDAPVPSAAEPPMVETARVDAADESPRVSDVPPFDPVHAATVLESARDPFGRCFREGRDRDPRLWGRLELIVLTAPDGRVSDVRERDSRFPDPAVVECARRVTSGLHFSHFAGQERQFVFALRLDKPAQNAE